MRPGMLFKNIKNQKLYTLVDVGLNVKNPSNKYVIYRQLYDSTLHGTDTKLPYGSIWIRDHDDFLIKFIEVLPKIMHK